MQKYYRHRYGSDLPDTKSPKKEMVDFSLHQDLTLPQLLYLKDEIEKRINELDKYRVETVKNINGLEYLLFWFEDGEFENGEFEDDEDGEGEDDNNFRKLWKSDRKIINELRMWFIKHGNPEDFEYTSGYYIDKGSICMRIRYTKWLYEQDLICHSYEGDSTWRYRYRYENPNNYKPSNKSSYRLTEMLNPLSEEELIAKFNSINKENNNDEFMQELSKFLHCRLLDSDYEWGSESPFIKLDINCIEFNY